jgi:hypothetical protein
MSPASKYKNSQQTSKYAALSGAGTVCQPDGTVEPAVLPEAVPAM